MSARLTGDERREAHHSVRANEKGPLKGALRCTGVVLSDRYDILCLRAFLALRDGEFDLLAFNE